MPDKPSPAAATVTAILPPALVTLFPGSASRVDVRASTVAELVDALDARWRGMGDRICDSRPAIRRHINIFVGGERANLDTALPPGTRVYILTAMSGG